MLLHELSTNAVKYGALSVPDGHVYLTWERSENGSIWLSWRESGGPRVKTPTAPGFGTTLIQQIIESQLGGTFRAHWDSEGYGMMMSLPETALQSTGRDARGPSAVDDLMASARKPSIHMEEDKGGTLLIVEDEPLLAMQLSQSLKDYGWNVLGVAGSIEDANRILAHSARPDAAILDVDLGGSPVFSARASPAAHRRALHLLHRL